ncbi:hypothetical protein [Ereboglobus sp. PH5-5]|uniref:hypothetical protein n=1 Tax=Ereboglobus sp. PH5-5 TaxID=2940529 RepID=UPI0024069D36|nr:hypothetical protein [Ereboglobus sp. PH5-5]
MIATPFLHASAPNPTKEELEKRIKERRGPETFAEIEELFAELPSFFHNYSEKAKEQSEVSFDSKGYMKLASALQKQREEHAVPMLRKLAKRPDGSKVAALCRMLFVARKDGVFRAPMWGAPDSLPRPDGKKWPLEPIAIMQGVPVLVTRGHALAGKVESAESYIEYCVAECDWRTQQFYTAKQRVIELAIAKILIDISPEGPWINQDWINFVQTQVRHASHRADTPTIWQDSSRKIPPEKNPALPGDFSSRRAALRKALCASFNINSIPPEREADFCEILTVYLHKERYLYNSITNISFSSPTKAYLNFFDNDSRHGGGASLTKMIGQWSAEFFYIE